MENQIKFYVDYDDNGKIIGFYGEGIHDNIPEKAILISSEDWREYIKDANKYKVDNGIIREKTIEEIDEEISMLPTPEPSLQERIEANEQALMALMEVMNVV